MKLLVYGPQHSCTKLFVGLLDKHPDVEWVKHLSAPSNGKYYNLDEFIKDCDFILVVSRDRSCINLSNKKDYKIPLEKDLAGEAYDNILENIVYTKVLDKVRFVSFETLVNYGYLYLEQIFRDLGLDTRKYKLCELIGWYKPKPVEGKEYWFKVNLEVTDSNAKYFKGE